MNSKKKLLCVVSESVLYDFIKRLEQEVRVKQVFNSDLSNVQQYLFRRLKIEPTNKVEVEHDNSKLSS